MRAIFAHAIIAMIIILQVLSKFSLHRLFYNCFLHWQFLQHFLKKSDRKLFKSNLFYVFPTIFVCFSGYILYFTFINNPKESIIGFGYSNYWDTTLFV